MTTHEYQYDINMLLGKDESGVLAGFLLQLDSILSENELDETSKRILDETFKMINDLQEESNYSYKDGYIDGYADAEDGVKSVF